LRKAGGTRRREGGGGASYGTIDSPGGEFKKNENWWKLDKEREGTSKGPGTERAGRISRLDEAMAEGRHIIRGRGKDLTLYPRFPNRGEDIKGKC